MVYMTEMRLGHHLYGESGTLSGLQCSERRAGLFGRLAFIWLIIL